MKMRQALASALALSVAALPLAIAQGSECSGPSTRPDTLNVGAPAGSGALDLYGPGGCTYGVRTDAPWLHVGVSEVTASDDQTVPIPYSYDENTGSGPRAGRIYVYDYNGYAGDSTYVEQAAAGTQDPGDAAPLGDPATGAGAPGSGSNQEPGFEGATLLAALGIAAFVLSRRR